MNIERMFQSEVRDKKRTASGIHHRASRRGYIRGGVKTPSDYLSKKEKNKLNGEVKVYNMFEKYAIIENVPQISEIEKMSESEKINFYKFLKKNHKNSILQKHWNISSTALYSRIYKKYGLYEPRKERNINIPKVEGLYKNITDIPSIKDILEMTESQKKGILVASKEQFSANALIKHWNISKYKLYDIYSKNEIPKINKIQNSELKTKVKTIDVKNTNSKKDTIEITEHNKQSLDKNVLKTIVNEVYNNIKQEQLNLKTIENGFKIEMHGIHNNEEIENRLLSIVNILSENKKYKISFKIEEI